MPEAMVADTPEAIELFAFLSLRARLRIEVRTGLRHSRGSTLAVVRSRYPQITARTKQAALNQMDDLLDAARHGTAVQVRA